MPNKTKDESIKVLFIGGYGRSGSTLIESILGRVDGFVVTGEIRHIFGRIVNDRELCNCGSEVYDCSYWNDILETAFPGGYNREKIDKAIRAVNKISSVPQVLYPSMRMPSMDEHITTYRKTFYSLYKAISKITGAKIVVDPSKYPLHGLVLSSPESEVDFSTMLLIRDPRAVANSWEHPKIRPEIQWEKRMMPKHNVVRSAFAWNLSNDLTKLIQKRGGNLRVQRYEDFTFDPLKEASEIASLMLEKNVTLTADIFQAKSKVQRHRLAGNPSSFGQKKIEIKTDEKWKKQMSTTKQLVVSLLCSPQMRKYGYANTGKAQYSYSSDFLTK